MRQQCEENLAEALAEGERALPDLVGCPSTTGQWLRKRS